MQYWQKLIVGLVIAMVALILFGKYGNKLFKNLKSTRRATQYSLTRSNEEVTRSLKDTRMPPHSYVLQEDKYANLFF